MTKKVGQRQVVQEIKSSEQNVVKKLQVKLEMIRLEEISSQKLWFRMDEMRDVVNQTNGAIIDKKGQRVLDRLKEISGKITGIICSWYDPKDVRVVLDLVGNE